ncbi:MAG: NADH-quinone oxidoreductase subunit D [Anaerolineae bacterium]|nr:NADH-quinone oxidoreductase subunit D [Anaerolineae bacterium]
MSTPSSDVTANDVTDVLFRKFPNAIQPDEREGYSGIIVSPDHLVEVAQSIRDDLRHDLLTSLSYVDYIDEGYFEVVYHAYDTRKGGPAFNFKARVPRDEAVLPSLTGVWLSANLQEREAWDLMGIRFTGHPNLKRLLTWEGFEGHPLRKDWREPFYEEEKKPFKSRWPEGHAERAENRLPYGMNVQYPPEFTPDGWVPEGDAAIYEALGAPTTDSGISLHHIKTDQLIVNMGPQHPSTHGVFRMAVTLDGETITRLEPVVGYLHRNHEKIGERNTYLGNMPFTDRLDYICSMSNNLAYALTVEKMIGQEVPERAELLRILVLELTRIINHFWLIGFLLNDLGAFFTPALYMIMERELILDLFEALSGSRMMCNYMRFGGVAYDLPSYVGGPAVKPGDKARYLDTMQFIKDLVYDRLPKATDQIDTFLTQNEVLVSRCKGVGILPTDLAIACGMTGPVLRASGVAYDIRRSDPYSIYNELDFDVAVRYNGDTYDRYLIRLDEIRQSLRILEQIIPRLEATEGQEYWAGKRGHTIRVPKGEHYGHADNPKGELGFYIVSDGTANPYRYHIRAPSLINITALEAMCQGLKVADSVVILGSLDIVLGELDR